MSENITREKLQKTLENGEVTLIEVLPEKYYNEGHIGGALQMNHNEIDDKADCLLPNKDAGIVVYCASETCSNSTMAVKKLEDKGYSHVRKYVGGKKDWVEAGLMLEV